MAATTIWRNAHLATMAGDGEPWGRVARGALVTHGDTLRWVGTEAELPGGLEADAEHDLGGALVTPGLVNTHHHLKQTHTRARAQDQNQFGWLREL
jgi:imidazolonepropionase